MFIFKSTPKEKSNNTPISLNEAINELWNLPIKNKENLPFIGFKNENHTIQFSRKNADTYLIDIPIKEYRKSVYGFSFEISLKDSIDIINELSKGEFNLRNLFPLTSSKK